MRPFLFLLLICLPAAASTPDQAQAVRTAYEKSAEAFDIRMKLAKTDAERRELATRRPDPLEAARRMWSVISSDLDKEWVVEPAGWFLRVVGPMAEDDGKGGRIPALRPEVAKVEEAVERHHLKHPRLASLCMGLVACGGNEALDLLRRIAAENPHKEASGVAALGVAMLAKQVGDDPRIMGERLSMLRRAIIDAADVDVGEVTVAELAREELYIIMNLTKGATAPELEGADSGGRPMRLSDFDGKVRLLVFWQSAGTGNDGLFEWVDALRRDERFTGKNFEVIGIHSGPRDDLRELQRDGRLTWPNFSDPDGELSKTYRIGMRPTAYVLGPDREIHFIGATGTFAELTAAAILTE